MGTKPMGERRTEDRWEVCLDAVWDGKSGNSARVTDLSEGGCYIDSICEASVGEVLQVKLHLPNGEWLELAGEVAHRTPPLGFGIRFVNLTPEQINRLRSIISQLKRPLLQHF